MKMHSVFALTLVTLMLLFDVGCKTTRFVEAESSAVVRQYVVLVDFSASRDIASRNEAKRFIQKLAHSLDFGDQLVLLRVQDEGIRDRREPLVFSIPTAKNPRHPSSDETDELDVWKQNVDDSLPSFFDIKDDAKHVHTDLFATFLMAGDYVRQRNSGQKVVVILSDMLQSADGFEMSHLRRMPSSSWIEAKRHQQQLPAFQGACIAVIGENVASNDDPELRSFWSQYFSAAGAKYDRKNIFLSPPEKTSSVCL